MPGVMIAAQIHRFLVQRRSHDRVDLTGLGQFHAFGHIFVGRFACPGVDSGKRQI